MTIPRIPADLSAAEDAAPLAYWRGHMDAKMEDLTSRVGSIEIKVDKILSDVGEIVSKMNAKDATEAQAKSAFRWLVPDSAALLAIVGAAVAIVLVLIK
jgi:archaellum component FlaD/FlaE